MHGVLDNMASDPQRVLAPKQHVDQANGASRLVSRGVSAQLVAAVRRRNAALLRSAGCPIINLKVLMKSGLIKVNGVRSVLPH